MEQTIRGCIRASEADDAEEERAIVKRAQRDPRCFAPLYERYFVRIYRYCLRRVGDVHEAEDLTSIIFTRVLSALGSYRGGTVAACLFRIAHNTVANHLRDRHPQADIALAENLSQPGRTLLDEVIRTETQVRIARLITNLPEEQRELLALRIAGELSMKEIAAVLGKTEGAVRVMLHRIVDELRSDLLENE